MRMQAYSKSLTQRRREAMINEDLEILDDEEGEEVKKRREEYEEVDWDLRD